MESWSQAVNNLNLLERGSVLPPFMGHFEELSTPREELPRKVSIKKLIPGGNGPRGVEDDEAALSKSDETIGMFKSKSTRVERRREGRARGA